MTINLAGKVCGPVAAGYAYRRTYAHVHCHVSHEMLCDYDPITLGSTQIDTLHEIPDTFPLDRIHGPRPISANGHCSYGSTTRDCSFWNTLVPDNIYFRVVSALEKVHLRCECARFILFVVPVTEGR